MERRAVLIVGFGGPERPEEVQPFLDALLAGRGVPPARKEQAASHYHAIGGGSPYNDHVRKQAAALKAALEREGVPLPVHIGMRNWHPYVDAALAALARGGAERIVAFVLAAHRCEASWGRYQAAVDEALTRLDGQRPDVVYPRPWHNHPLFIRALAARTGEAIARLPESDRSRARLVLTAHSVPVAMDGADSYVAELHETGRLLAKNLGFGSFALAFQSRSGNPREPWLEPDLAHILTGLAGQTVVLVPIGFLCDHLEVLYDLDVQGAEFARTLGIRMERAPTVGDHPLFIAMMAAVVRASFA